VKSRISFLVHSCSMVLDIPDVCMAVDTAWVALERLHFLALYSHSDVTDTDYVYIHHSYSRMRHPAYHIRDVQC
jgi:hypothetical protein